ncbi:DoxX family protein, partial [Mycobacterium sp. GA-1841]|uniref:DoxX family protein n=1 Tax=Mycobacterium sp. GA-1841 TaxID=1834154 RepID=UPI00210F90BF
MASDTALLVLRVVLGLTMAAHGYNKFFGGGRIPGTAGWFDSIGMKPGLFHARVAATTEIAAGLGLALGLLTPIPAAGFVALMLVAAWTVHRANGFFIVKEGWEYNLILAVAGGGGGGRPPPKEGFKPRIKKKKKGRAGGAASPLPPKRPTTTP